MIVTMRFPGGRDRALTFSYDDGIVQDARLVGIFVKNGLKGTFNLNAGLVPAEEMTGGKRRLTMKQIVGLYPAAGMEVAIHGYTHPHLELMPAAQVTAELLHDREAFEAALGVPVCGMAYPYGSFNDTVIDCMKACGIKYSRTTVSTGGFGIPSDWLRLPATCHHNDERLFPLADHFVDAGPRPANNDPWLFYVWGHSYEFDDADNWERIETFAARVGGHNHIWYATNMDIYEYVSAWRSLTFTTDGTVVTNRSSIDLWGLADGKPVMIPAGRTTRLA